MRIFFKLLSIQAPFYSLKRVCGLLCLLFLMQPNNLLASTPQYQIEIKNHLFIPSKLEIPANIKVKLIVVNHDATSEEFESYELNREKIIMGGRKAVIFIGPLAPGEYPFFGEFNPKTAQGKIIAVEKK